VEEVAGGGPEFAGGGPEVAGGGPEVAGSGPEFAGGGPAFAGSEPESAGAAAGVSDLELLLGPVSASRAAYPATVDATPMPKSIPIFFKIFPQPAFLATAPPIGSPR